MTEARRIQLHLGKCIEDLDEMHNVSDLCQSAQKLFENAEEMRAKGDEESSYVYYMKYLRLLSYIMKDKEYLKDKSYFRNMLGAKNPTKAIDATEKLKISLMDRYEKEQKVKRNNDIKENELVKTMENITVIEPPQLLGLPDPDEVIISSENLYQVLKCGKLKVMIMDARPGKDYVESHINHPACISVPEECISPGKTANVLEQNLPAESRLVWAQRASMDLIVLLDWNSATVIPGKTLYLLKNILLKWDIKVRYSRQPLALKEGYEDWLLRYPALTTNPSVVPPRSNDMLGEIQYPQCTEVSGPPAGAPRRPGEPLVDRTSKAAALQVYEERSLDMQLILKEQERIADTSLTLEMQRIEAEMDWKKVRRQHDESQDESLRAKYELRGQEITTQLMQIENKRYDIELENMSLCEQLEEYQRREEAARLAKSLAAGAEPEGGPRPAESAALAAQRERIAHVHAQRDRLGRTSEALETERKRKLNEARGKRKPIFDKVQKNASTGL